MRRRQRRGSREAFAAAAGLSRRSLAGCRPAVPDFHLFQPLTYQVATGALSPGEVAYPLRAVFRRHRNVRVLMAEVSGFDIEGRRVRLAQGSLPYDTLIVPGGSHSSYFGHDDWRRYAPEVKSLESALATRARILSAFEAAETEPSPDRRRALLTFVVVGAGSVTWCAHAAATAASKRFSASRRSRCNSVATQPSSFVRASAASRSGRSTI